MFESLRIPTVRKCWNIYVLPKNDNFCIYMTMKTISSLMYGYKLSHVGHLVQTAQVNSLAFPYGGQGREPHELSARYSSAPS
jgi:hypothetical protein